MALSPNRRYAAATLDGLTLRVWNLDNPQEAVDMQPGERMVFTGMAFSPDDRTLAAGNSQDELLVFDAHSGKLLRRWASHPGRKQVDWTFAFSPDGEKLATSRSINSIDLYDYSSGAWLGEINPPFLFDSASWRWLEFSPSADAILAAGDFGTGITVWNTNTFQLEQEILASNASFLQDVEWDAGQDTVQVIHQGGQGSLLEQYQAVPEARLISQAELPGEYQAKTGQGLWVTASFSSPLVNLYSIREGASLAELTLPGDAFSTDFEVDQVAFNGQDLLVLFNGKLAVFRPAKNK